MKRVIAVLSVFGLLGTTLAVAAPAKQANKITHTRIVQANKDTTLTYNGVKVFVPAGQSIILGQNSNGTIVVSGQNLSGVKIGEGTISAQGPVVLLVQPQTNVITVNRGRDVQVTDSNGRTAALSQGASVSAKDIRANTVPIVEANQANSKPAATKAAANKAESAAQVTTNTNEVADALPNFVADSVVESAANEQAAQDVEETLSPSAPR